MAKYDLHTHLFTTWEKGRLSLERASRNPDYLLDCVKRAGLDGIALVNFGDYRYERFADSASECKRYKLSNNTGNALVFEDDKHPCIKVIKGQEIPTDKGHLLVLGLDYGANLDHRSLQDVTAVARDLGALVIPDHWWAEFGIGKNEVITNSKEFAAFEQGNGNFNDPLEDDVGDIIRETGLFGIDTSDSHNRRDLGNGYIEVPREFDFSSRDNLSESIRHALRGGLFASVRARSNPLSSRLGHMFVVCYDVFIRRKIGLL